MKFKGRFRIVVSMVRENVQECPHKVKALPCDVGYLEYRADSLAHKLRCSIDGLFAILDEHRNFSCPWRLQYFGELSDGILQDLGRAYIDFGDNNHDRHVKSQSNAQVLS